MGTVGPAPRETCWSGPDSDGTALPAKVWCSLSAARSVDLFPPLYLVGRGGELELDLDLPRRLGGAAEQRVTDDPAEGWSWVRAEIEGGRPVMLWADIAELPYLRVKLSMSRHDIVVIGFAHQPPNYPFPPMHFGVP